jgi:hypothetical protein
VHIEQIFILQPDKYWKVQNMVVQIRPMVFVMRIANSICKGTHGILSYIKRRWSCKYGNVQILVRMFMWLQSPTPLPQKHCQTQSLLLCGLFKYIIYTEIYMAIFTAFMLSFFHPLSIWSLKFVLTTAFGCWQPSKCQKYNSKEKHNKSYVNH